MQATGNDRASKTAANTKSPPKRQLKRFLTEEALKSLPKASIEKRKQIIESAIECFLELGYKGTSMNAVAERAGVIKQTIYSHFEDKEALFKTVIQSVTVDHVRSELGAPGMADKSVREMLLKVAQTILARHRNPQQVKFVRMMIGETARFPELAKVFNEVTIRPSIELIASLLRRQGDSQFPDPEAFARVFCGAIINFCIQQYVLDGIKFYPFEQERLLNELLRLFDLHRVP